MPRPKAVIKKAKGKEPNVYQLPLDLKDYTPTKIEMKPEDVGGALTSILSEGLYTNPMHAIREYVQNSVDAGAKKVIIKLTGNSVTIHDDGNGMNLAELLQARQFGISRKSYAQQVGFRGIGLYSGFDLCNRLVITTQKKGESKRYSLTFDFAAMKLKILSEQVDRSLPPTPLITLISEHSTFTQEPGDSSKHWTNVVLEDVKPFHIQRLYNTDDLRDYILAHLPIDFDDTFEFKEKINEELERLPGYRAAHVIIQADGKSDILIAKPAIPDLQDPELGFIKNPKGEKIAFYWSCLNKNRGKIDEEFKDFRGFTYKVKGFTIGDNRRLQSYFSPRGGQGLYWWLVGEIHVIDPNVIPNAERNDFQSSPAKSDLEIAVQQQLQTLENKAARFQSEGRALDELKRVEKQVAEIEQTIQGDQAQDRATLIIDLAGALKDLRRQKSSLPTRKREEAGKLIEKAEHLLNKLRKDIGSPALPAGKPRKKPVSSDQPQNELLFPIPEIPPRKRFSRTLTQTLEESSWGVPDDARRIFGIIDAALADVLVVGSPTYTKLLMYIEGLLSEDSE